MVVDAGQIEGSIAVADLHPLVAKRTDSELADPRQPGLGAGVVVVIPGDEVDAVRGPELAEGLHLVLELADAAVHQIAGQGDQIGSQAVHLRDQPRGKLALENRPDVDVAELDDPEPIA